MSWQRQRRAYVGHERHQWHSADLGGRHEHAAQNRAQPRAHPAARVVQTRTVFGNQIEAPPRITSPASGAIIALDPDVPPNRQRLSYSADGQAVRWLMDGQAFAGGPQAQWLP